MKPRSSLLSLALLSFVFPAAVRAAWSPDGNPVVVAPGTQSSFVAMPLDGGVFVAWVDERADAGDVYAQSLDASGDPRSGWPATGVAVCTASGLQRQVSIAPDGAGGAYVSWVDRRTGSPAHYLQHVAADGSPASGWPTDGRFVADDPYAYYEPYALAPDAAGGVFACWTADGPQVAHFDASGALEAGWPVSVGMGPADAHQFTLTADGAGGVFVAGMTEFSYVTLNRLRSDGAVQPGWPDTGVAVAPYSGGRPRLVLDDAGGVYVTWIDFMVCDHCEYVVRARRAGGDGTLDPAWLAYGEYLGADNGALAPDGVGGLLSAWASGWDFFSPRSYAGRATRVSSDAGRPPGWTASGDSVCDQPYDQRSLAVAPDGGGGAFLSWIDFRDHGAAALYANHLDATSITAAGWPTPGSLECLAAVSPSSPVLVAPEPGRAIAVWIDERNGDRDLFARELVPGPPGPPSPLAVDPEGPHGFGIDRVYPNPSRGAFHVVLRLPDAAPVSVELVDLAGRRVESRRFSLAGPSRGAVSVGHDALSPGVYWLRVAHGTRVLTRRVVLAR